MQLRSPFSALALVAGALVIMPAASQAALYDFTSAGWSGADGQATFTSGNVTAAALPSGNLLSSQAFDGSPAACGSGLACARDGLGIGDDEVTYGAAATREVLRLTFNTAVNITGIDFLDLFQAQTQTSDPSTEVARFRVTFAGGSTADGTATGTALDTTGFLRLATLFNNVKQIDFFAAAPSPENTDFAVAAISGAVVPIPAALPLLGSALAGLGVFGRRRSPATAA